ncbi:Rz-like lysis system protein LysB [Erwiniaceae bacterium BAC15a-03b]|uniref:Rz-like lysis system protein LysB n=1 Tax=Winslowiella arboricola TaxID=2978220 RepID=A0A9J6PSB9_9GAMM|nr:Rz-like lysis system protein LysB [Winslowiella arboricola]MCU5775851.1 Rz-like lysis system protein LysB [Winslowiella arboricola]MCU5779299.1 Rz-like lysis system protein LysB [Winslowiella arboricola]
MNRLLLSLTGVLIAALAFTGWRASHLDGELAAARRVIGTLSAGIESRDNAISRLQSEASDREQSELALRTDLGKASALTLTRQFNDQKVTDSDEALQKWSRTPLPDAVIRLHQRPAFASAADYLRWLSEGDKLPDTGQ